MRSNLDYEAEYIEGFVENIIYRNEDNGYTVFNVVYKGEEITCVGVFSYINAGEFITANGGFVKHPSYDMQFSIKSYEFKAPDDTKSVRRYLASGAIKGIGEKMAERIVKEFGDDTFRIMEEEPERLAEIKGISLTKAMDIAAQLVDKRDMRKAMMFLQDYGISMGIAGKIYSRYGQEIYTIIKQNPYRLADDIDGIGFKTADEIAAKAGIKVDSDFRIRSGILYVLTQAAGQGHIYLPWTELEQGVTALLLIDIRDMERHIMDMAIDKKIVVRENASGEKCIYASMYYYMEASIAKHLIELNIPYSQDEAEIGQRIAQIEEKNDIILDDIQKQAVHKAVLNGLMVITGGPGTGKTTTINLMIRCFEMEKMDIVLAAPTGRAAKRMTEATGYEAKTIHRLLEVSGGIEDGDSSHFEKNEDNPIEADAVILDEMSMVDIHLMYSLLKAIVPGTRLILVGDSNQLPSVGPGNVLKDIIDSKAFSVVRLSKIYRQAESSHIVLNAHKINAGELITLDNKNKDFFFFEKKDVRSVMGALVYLVKTRLPEYIGASPFEIQVLTPMRKGELGVEHLNEVLQYYLNPASESKKEKEGRTGVFREGDKVMQVKNNYKLEWKITNAKGFSIEEGLGVFNGDMGIIKQINTYSERITVVFDENREAEYPFSSLDELELAYAITIHKSQGSEYPAVVLPLLSGPPILCNRNLLYTAITRAQKCVAIAGRQSMVEQMIHNETEQKRYSGLNDCLKEGL